MPFTASDICKIIFAIILPPLGVFLERGCGADLLINICLTILGWIPESPTQLADRRFSATLADHALKDHSAMRRAFHASLLSCHHVESRGYTECP
ncbi:uncharacterized protein N7496_001312 [Penicillium cataractarum]|uniref:Plasma membrane proteolipid 3 n=1 Tax=Penicillium cataractarum TaxID=2100454 RepID=A0A9X0B6Q9_9EURO|nr:uncharacterized protein N7496_001312 [Penicillium cataractarum]KAJ5390244.1 hypothetical protein N7496_001312 [Penicillium cataractarum]